MKIINVKNVNIGTGSPKIIIPIIGSSEKELINGLHNLIEEHIYFDVIEWRADCFKSYNDLDILKSTLKKIRQLLPNKPLLFTFRTAKEGGSQEISLQNYIKLNLEIIATKLVDLIDIEIFIDDEAVKMLIDFAHQHNIYVVGSKHYFNQTPNQQEIVKCLKKIQSYNADLPKIAVMPKSVQDVLTLLSATTEMIDNYADRPIITISMGHLGVISRISGETFGSAMTFGTAKHASAPGQLDAKSLKVILDILHQHSN